MQVLCLRVKIRKTEILSVYPQVDSEHIMHTRHNATTLSSTFVYVPFDYYTFAGNSDCSDA